MLAARESIRHVATNAEYLRESRHLLLTWFPSSTRNVIGLRVFVQNLTNLEREVSWVKG